MAFLWEPAASTYVAVTPARILDTRDGTGRVRSGRPAGGTVEVAVTGVAGVPVRRRGRDPQRHRHRRHAVDSYLTVFPTGAIRPLASNLNFNAGKTVPNLVMARVGERWKVTIYNNSGTADVVADLQGWYASPINALGVRYVAAGAGPGAGHP